MTASSTSTATEQQPPPQNREQRKAIAQDTLRVCNEGIVRKSDGETYDVSAAVAESIASTVYYDPATAPPPSKAKGRPGATRFETTAEGTVGAARRLTAEGHSVAALNFASAKHPGGGFIGGAEAQEENIARNSTIYACLMSKDALRFYDSRHVKGTNGLYSHAIIYSPGVPAFRTDEGATLAAPWSCAYLTAAAPNAGVARREGLAEEQIATVLRERAERVLAIAAAHGHDAVVLGAWGCGVFKNDPALVAAIFKDLLRSERFRGAFARVCFAVYGRGPDVNRQAFEAAFGA